MNQSSKGEVEDPLIGLPDTLNPYRHGAGLILSRLRWDLSPESRRSRSKLKALKNRHAGERAVILCNGPSLNKVDFPAVQGTYTFGLNKINLIFERSQFRPSCVVSVNELVLEQNREFFNETRIPLFLDSAAYSNGIVSTGDNRVFLHSSDARYFSRDCSLSIHQGHTVTYVAMQLAFHMGFSRVALVGCDHSFATKGPANAAVTAGDTDESHFDPRYFSGGVKWQLPDLAESEAAYERARRVFEGHGRQLINATEGGQLDLLQRMSLSDFMQDNR